MSTPEIRLEDPIVLVHGLGARASYGPFDYFFGIPNLLRSAGNSVFLPSLTAWQSIETRAEQLKEQIEKEFPNPDQKINLIGHSMGGLDARYVVSKLGLGNRVKSVTTIGTPNQGTKICDLGLKYMPIGAAQAVEKVLGYVDSSHRGLEQVSCKYHEETFSKEAPNLPGVAYFSATSVVRNPVFKTALPFFWVSSQVLNALEGDNDGFVSVESAKLGDHICTYTGDHYGQIGQFLGRSRGLDHYQFFSEILAHMKKQGM